MMWRQSLKILTQENWWANMKETYNTNPVKGHLRIYQEKDGLRELIHEQDNLILYSASDIMAKAIVGDNLVITGMYMEYDNSGTPPTPTVSEDRKTDYYEGLSGDQGYIRVPVSCKAGYASSDESKYEGNIVTIHAKTNGTVVNGPGMIDNTSQIYSAALVAMPDPSDRSKDVIFSATNLTSPVPKIANAQVSISWDIKC